MWSAPSSQPSCLIERKFFCIIWDYFRIYYKIFNIWVLRSLVSHSKGLFRKYIEKYVRNSQKNSSIFFFIQTIGGFSREYLASSRWSSLIFSRNSLCRYKPQSALYYSAALCTYFHLVSQSYFGSLPWLPRWCCRSRRSRCCRCNNLDYSVLRSIQ